MPSLKELLCLFPLTQRLTIPSKPKADLLGPRYVPVSRLDAVFYSLFVLDIFVLF